MDWGIFLVFVLKVLERCSRLFNPFNPELLFCWNSIREAQWIHLNTSHWDLHDSCDELRSKFVRLAFTAARLFWTSLEPKRQVPPPCKYCTFCIVRHTAIHRFCEREDRETFYLNQRCLRTLKGEVPEQPVGGAETKRNPVRRNFPPVPLSAFTSSVSWIQNVLVQPSKPLNLWTRRASVYIYVFKESSCRTGLSVWLVFACYCCSSFAVVCHCNPSPSCLKSSQDPLYTDKVVHAHQRLLQIILTWCECIFMHLLL